MLKIQTLNEISPIINNHLTSGEFELSNNVDAPDAIVVRSADMHKSPLPQSVLAVARAGAGTNNIPVAACGPQGVVVFNTPGANANAVKELVIAAMLMSGRRVIQGVEWVQALRGQGDAVPALVEKGKSQFVGPEMAGKQLGIIGLGAIGVLVANSAVGMDMAVEGFDPFITVEHAMGLTRAVRLTNALDALLAESDFVSVHVPYNEKTKGYIGAEQLKKMKPGAVLMNFSRAELCDTKAVLKSLDDGHLRMYITDFPTDELLTHPGVLCIPHLGASTPESEENCADMAARQLRDYLLCGAIRNSVNYPDCALTYDFAHRTCVMHSNTSGMVGQIAAAFGEFGVNISNMVNVSRGELAYTVVDTEDGINAEILGRIEGIAGVYRGRVL
ncbi:MAG: 3-phosphoglycerate dehydrogenase family protein [Clostridia bacterium]|nr:3-phosphoglycerate dehydrogenase family protein [Clostridia bacterium]